jgi:hypothetical protein
MNPRSRNSHTTLTSTGLLCAFLASNALVRVRGHIGHGVCCDWATRYICNSIMSCRACWQPTLIVRSGGVIDSPLGRLEGINGRVAPSARIFGQQDGFSGGCGRIDPRSIKATAKNVHKRYDLFSIVNQSEFMFFDFGSRAGSCRNENGGQIGRCSKQ